MARRSRFLVSLMFLATVGLALPPDLAAQRAVPRGGGRTGTAVPRTYAPHGYRPYSNPRYYGGYPRYSYPYAYSRYYYPYYSSFAFGFGFGLGFGWPGAYWGSFGYPYYGYPYYGYPYYGYPSYGYPAYGYPSYPAAYPYYGYDNSGSARLQISPREAQVYVDGRFVGLVDDFDGSFQQLRVEAGQHQLQVYLDGYRAYTENVLFRPGTTVKLQGKLEPLRPGEPAEPKPTPNPVIRPPDAYQRPAPATAHRASEPAATSEPARTSEPTEFGTLATRVTPPDAVILVDGEAWTRPQGENRFSIDLAEGPHRVEVRKEGFRPYVRSIDILGGRTFTLNVSLSPGGSGQLRVSR